MRVCVCVCVCVFVWVHPHLSPSAGFDSARTQKGIKNVYQEEDVFIDWSVDAAQMCTAALTMCTPIHKHSG